MKKELREVAAAINARIKAWIDIDDFSEYREPKNEEHDYNQEDDPDKHSHISYNGDY